MTAPFIIKLALSFLIGGLWIGLGTALAERRGPKFGGLIIGFPSTVLFALFFIAWTQSTRAAVQATTVIPAVHGINCLFLLIAVSFLGRSLWIALAAGLGVWFVLSFALIAAKFDSFSGGLLIYAALLVLSYVLIGSSPPGGPRAERPLRSSGLLSLSRGALGGAIVALAVLLAKATGPLIGGVFAVFPAIFTGALLVTHVWQGPAFSASLMRASLLGGISVVVYASMVRLTYLPLGLGGGTAVAVAAALASTILIGAFSVKKQFSR